MKKTRLGVSLAVTLVVGAMEGRTAFSQITPEQDSLRVSQKLKPIPDEEWNQIAGTKTSEKYEIVKGDTLYDISKRLFGDSKYWPKIWALNNRSITNPHLIRPGNQIQFLPGTGTSLPAVSIQEGGKLGSTSNSTSTLPSALAAANETSPVPSGGTPLGPDGEPPETSHPNRSKEWQSLPKQSWEFVTLSRAAEVDSQGFDRRSKIVFARNHGDELEDFVTTEPLMGSGVIQGGRVESTNFFMHDIVFVDSTEDLQVGEAYTIVADPGRLKSERSGRKLFSYINLGRVRIIGVKDSLFVGSIESAKFTIQRGNILVPLLKRSDNLVPIPAPNPVEGNVVFEKTFSSWNAAQHKTVYVDRGSDDGVRPGMVFRIYQHQDPSTKKRITDSDYIVIADVMVRHTTERTSTGTIIRSVNTIQDDALAVLLTDVTDLIGIKGVREKSIDNKDVKDKELNRLDDLDVSGGLGNQENKELKQLEKWNDKQEPLAEPSGQPSPAPQPQTEQLQEQPPVDETAAPPAQDPPPTAPTTPPATQPAVEPNTSLVPETEEGLGAPPPAPGGSGTSLPQPPASSQDLDNLLSE